jgi:hypothetical protein
VNKFIVQTFDTCHPVYGPVSHIVKVIFTPTGQSVWRYAGRNISWTTKSCIKELMDIVGTEKIKQEMDW